MRKVIVFLGVVVAAGMGLVPALSQESAPGIIYSRFRQFRIPFTPDPAEQARLRQLHLFVSMDQGRTWQPVSTAPPEQRHFRFMTDRDGYFWFTVQAQYQDGRLFPSSMDKAQPNLKVVVDTQPPVVILQGLPPRGDEVGVAWDIRDENLDLSLPDALQLEYRPAGTGTWIPLPRVGPAAQRYFNPMARGPVEVRLRARDRAGNWGEAIVTVALDGQGFSGNNEVPPVTGLGTVPANRKLVKSRRITLHYDLKDVGPSGVSEIELWFTQDGRSWNKYPPRVPVQAGDLQKSLVFEVAGEGIYGLSLVAKSGVGLSVRPPQLGDRPQIWIEVDMTKPVVQIHQVMVGQGTDKGKLMVSWTARDKNLGPQPIALSYADKAAGPWTTIAQGLANNGRHVWTLPENGVPFQFFVRVEARDLAGNMGFAVTSERVKVDLSQPQVQILTVEPAGSVSSPPPP